MIKFQFYQHRTTPAKHTTFQDSHFMFIIIQFAYTAEIELQMKISGWQLIYKTYSLANTATHLTVSDDSATIRNAGAATNPFIQNDKCDRHLIWQQ